MADLINIRLDNSRQVQDAFRRAPGRMTKMLSITLKAAALMVQSESMQNTPVLTGRLRASHYIRFEPLSAEVGPNTNYAFFVHEGTRFMAGRPFLAEAVEDKRKAVTDLFTRGTQEVLNEIGRAT